MWSWTSSIDVAEACWNCTLANHTPHLLNCSMRFNKMPMWSVYRQGLRSIVLGQGLMSSLFPNLLQVASQSPDPFPSGHTHLPASCLLWERGLVSCRGTSTSPVGAFSLVRFRFRGAAAPLSCALTSKRSLFCSNFPSFPRCGSWNISS